MLSFFYRFYKGFVVKLYFIKDVSKSNSNLSRTTEDSMYIIKRKTFMLRSHLDFKYIKINMIFF